MNTSKRRASCTGAADIRFALESRYRVQGFGSRAFEDDVSHRSAQGHGFRWLPRSRAAGARRRVRVSPVPLASGGHHRDGDRGRRCAGADAHGRRQVAVLSDPRPRAARHGHRRLAADRAHAGPGRGADASRREGSVSKLDARLSGADGARGPHRRGRARRPLCVTREAAAGAHALVAGTHRAVAVRHRRSALRLPVGPRLPARIPPAQGSRRAVSRPSRASR